MRYQGLLVALVFSVVLFFAGTAYAQGSWQIVQFDMTIMPAEETPPEPQGAAFQMFVDEEATMALGTVHFGQVVTDQHLLFDIYVKNTGDTEGIAGIRVVEDTSTWLTWSVTEPQLIAVGAVATFTWTADVIAVVDVETEAIAHFECYTP